MTGSCRRDACVSRSFRVSSGVIVAAVLAALLVMIGVPAETASAAGQQHALGQMAFMDPPGPVLEIVKTVVEGPSGICPDFDQGVAGDGEALTVLYGDVVTYCIAVRNSGDSSASSVAVVDAQAPGQFDFGSLAANAVEAASYDITIDAQTPALNTATVSGNGPDGALPEASDTALIEASPIPEPNLQVVKTAVVGPNGTCPTIAAGVPGPGTPVEVTDGGTVTYCVSVLNGGPGVATNVVITDVQAPAPIDLGTLVGQTGQTVKYDVPVTLQTAETNTAIVTGDGPTGALPEVSDTAVITISGLPLPQLEFVKTAVRGANIACPSFDAGTPGRGEPIEVFETETITYCLTVRNVGDGDATNVVLSDSQAANVFGLTIGDLAVDQEVTRSFEIVVSLQTEAVNIAFADGDGPYGPVRQVNDEAEIAVSLQPDPVLEIVKTVVAGPGGTCPDFAEGVAGDGPALSVLFDDVVTYCLAVTNSGDNDAESVQVSDPQAPGLFSIGAVAVGEEVLRSYDITVDEATEERNTATVTGVGPNGQLPEASDAALIEASAQPDPVLDIVNTVIEGPGGTCPAFDAGVAGDGEALEVFYGDVVTYCITVRNSGERTASDVEITNTAEEPFEVGTLAVDESVTVSHDVVVDAQTPQQNTATVSGEGPNGDLPESSDAALIDAQPEPEPDPELNIVLTAVSGPAGTCPSFDDGVIGVGDALPVDIGETVTYCVSVRNLGESDATTVVIDDQQGPVSLVVGTVAVDETVDRSYDVVVELETPLTNTAMVTGAGPNGLLPAVGDDAMINPSKIALVHQAVNAETDCADSGDEVDLVVVDGENLNLRWCYQITNTGTVPVANIALSLPDLGVADIDVLQNADGSLLIDENGDAVPTSSASAVAQGAPTQGSANVEPGAAALLPNETVSIDIATVLPVGGLSSRANVTADPSDVQGELLGLPQLAVGEDLEVRDGAVQLETTVAPGADADCSSSAGLIIASVDEPVTWCFTVTNLGSLDVRVADIVDETLDTTIAIADDSRVLAPNAALTVSLSNVVPGSIINRAFVQAVALDSAGETIAHAPALGDDDTAEIRLPDVNVGIEVAVSDAGPVAPGTVLTYTVTVSNAGPDAASAIEVADVLPTGLQYDALPGAAGWACSLDGAQGFLCSMFDDLQSGLSETLTFTAVVEASAPTAVDLESVTTVETTANDVDLENNTDLVTTRVATPAEVLLAGSQLASPGDLSSSDSQEEAGSGDEVLGISVTNSASGQDPLALTGSTSRELGLLSAVMLALGALLMVGSRRSRDRRFG